jgi:hypothetical protein
MLIHDTNRVRPDSCLIRWALFGILDSDQEINDEDYLFMVPTRRESRAGGREGASRRCSGNAWDLRPSSPRCRSSLAGIDSPRSTPCRRDLIVFRTLPWGRHMFLSICRKLRCHFPLEHLEQLVNPAGFNLAVRRHFIDHVRQPARSVLRKSDAVFLAPESVPR